MIVESLGSLIKAAQGRFHRQHFRFVRALKTLMLEVGVSYVENVNKI